MLEEQLVTIRVKSIDLCTREVPCVEVTDVDSASTSSNEEATSPRTPTYADIVAGRITPPLSPNDRYSRSSGLPLGDSEREYRPAFSFRKLWAFTGPGLIMSVAFLVRRLLYIVL